MTLLALYSCRIKPGCSRAVVVAGAADAPQREVRADDGERELRQHDLDLLDCPVPVQKAECADLRGRMRAHAPHEEVLLQVDG